MSYPIGVLPATLSETPFTPEQVEIFTNGDCWALARELYELGAGDFVLLYPTSDSSGKALKLCWGHAMIQRPDGRYLDARGLYGEDELKVQWDWLLHGEGAHTRRVTQEEFLHATSSEHRCWPEEDAAKAAALLYAHFCS